MMWVTKLCTEKKQWNVNIVHFFSCIDYFNFSDNYFDRSILLHGSFVHIYFIFVIMCVSLCVRYYIWEAVALGARDIKYFWSRSYRQQWAPPCGFWEFNSGPLKEQYVVLIYLFSSLKKWKYNIITFLHSDLPSKPSNMSLQLSFRYMTSLFINCCCMNRCMCT